MVKTEQEGDLRTRRVCKSRYIEDVVVQCAAKGKSRWTWHSGSDAGIQIAENWLDNSAIVEEKLFTLQSIESERLQKSSGTMPFDADMQEIVNDFLIESYEGLEETDSALIALEKKVSYLFSQ